MMTLNSVFVFIAIACFHQANISLAFTTTSCQKTAGVALMTSKRQAHHDRHHRRLLHVMNAEEDDENEASSPPPQPSSPPVVRSNSPPPVRNIERMDPLMASLTRDNRDPAQVTRNIPLFGEVPADGSLKLLIPAALFAILGFGLSIVVAVKSSGQIAGTFSTVADSIVQSSINQPNQVYDENACRGICSSQQDDIDGLRRFMESVTKKN